MKMMLDSATLSSTSKEGEEVDQTVYVPTPAQREMIESDAFETAKFVSHRTADKVGIIIEMTSPCTHSNLRSGGLISGCANSGAD